MYLYRGSNYKGTQVTKRANLTALRFQLFDHQAAADIAMSMASSSINNNRVRILAIGILAL